MDDEDGFASFAAVDPSETLAEDDTESQESKPKPASNAKDANRPRRKKARRACFACQRAHLTCGDERPCQRCIKRNIADHCSDGVRKKAKYLQDAPDELTTGFVGSVPKPHIRQQSNGGQPFRSNPPNVDITSPVLSPTTGMMPQMSPLQGNLPQGQPWFDPSDPSIFNFDINSFNFGSQYGALEFGMLGQLSGANGVAQTPSDSSTGLGQYGQGIAQFAGSPPNHSLPYSTYSESMDGLTAWTTNSPPASRNDSYGGGGNVGAGGGLGGGSMMSLHGTQFPNTYSIGAAGPGSQPSPGSANSPHQPNASLYQGDYSHFGGPLGSPTSQSMFNSTNIATTRQSSPPLPQRTVSYPTPTTQPQPSAPPMAQMTQPPQLRPSHHRTPKDPSLIYSSITQPYPYTEAFHRLFSVLKMRFPKEVIVRIAKSMSSYRPSFIACTKTLKDDDLIFMEKCFQRTLWEYEKFIGYCGTPTIVCRRTGEVAAVGKEFCILTGWSRDTLLGLNLNRDAHIQQGFIQDQIMRGKGGADAIPTTEPNSGTATPGMFASGLNSGTGSSTPWRRKGPVFLAELLDDESVTNFYEDFAKLAFGDSRGAIMTRCKVLKFKPERDGVHQHPEPNQRKEVETEEPGREDGKTNGLSSLGPNRKRKREGKTKKPVSVGDKDTLECAFCWTVKRDIFDMPMLIVGNFLPILKGGD